MASVKNDSQTEKLVTVASVRFIGANHTSNALLAVHATPLLALTSRTNPATGSPESDESERQTFEHVARLAHDAASRLHRLGIFKTVDVVLDAPHANPNNVHVVFHLHEASRLYAKTGTELGNNEGAMNAAVKIRNALGNAESLEANVSYGVETSSGSTTTANIDSSHRTPIFSSQLASSFHLLFTRPVNADPDKIFSLSASKQNKAMNLYSSYSEQISGIAAKFKILNSERGVIHEISYDAAWRRLFDLGSNASWR